jgi:hypothetical protein
MRNPSVRRRLIEYRDDAARRGGLFRAGTERDDEPMSGSDDERPGSGNGVEDADPDGLDDTAEIYEIYDVDDVDDDRQPGEWPLKRVGRPRYRVALKRRRR